MFSQAISKAATASGDSSGGSLIKASTTLAAYAIAFAIELDHVEHEIIRLQDTYAAHSRTGPRDASTVNLVTLDLACQVTFALSLVLTSHQQNPMLLQQGP